MATKPKKSTQARSKTARRAAGTEPTGCKYVAEWAPLRSTKGFVQVWVPEAEYEKAAKSLMKKTRDTHARALLRQKMLPLGVTHKCTGTCYGGWCKEVTMSPGVFICECSYFV
jgi:hypothetical protein